MTCLVHLEHAALNFTYPATMQMQ